jgi:hypothetical protein
LLVLNRERSPTQGFGRIVAPKQAQFCHATVTRTALREVSKACLKVLLSFVVSAGLQHCVAESSETNRKMPVALFLFAHGDIPA